MRKRTIAYVAFAIALAGISSTPAAADDAACTAQDPTPASRIEACTALLKDAAPGYRRVTLLYARGSAYQRAQRFVAALTDFREADAALPDDGNVMLAVAITYNDLG